jgi:hypothetical protein
VKPVSKLPFVQGACGGESGKCVVTVSIVIVLERRQRFCTPLVVN